MTATATTRIGKCFKCGADVEQSLAFDDPPIWLPKVCSRRCEAISRLERRRFSARIREGREMHVLKNHLANSGLRPAMRDGKFTLESLPGLYAETRQAGGVDPARYREVATAIKDFVAVPPLLRGSGIASIVYLYGEKGTGKTWLLEAAIAYAVRELSLSAVFTSHEDIVSQVLRSFSSDGITKEESQAAVIGNLQNVVLCGIDDVGRKTSPTEFELNVLLRVVDERYRLSKPTIISSNYSVKELFQLWSDADDPRKTKLAELLCDRLADVKAAISLPMKGKSLRRDK